MESRTTDHILDETACVSLITHAIGKGLNYLCPQIYGQTVVLSFVKTQVLEKPMSDFNPFTLDLEIECIYHPEGGGGVNIYIYIYIYKYIYIYIYI